MKSGKVVRYRIRRTGLQKNKPYLNFATYNSNSLTENHNNSGVQYYSLLELTQSIENIIGKSYNRTYWVKAEIAKLNYYPKSGHCYPDLVEKRNGKVVAQMRATIWSGSMVEISSKFRKETKENLSDGMAVLLRVSVKFSPVYGLSLHVVDIEPSFTLGELAKEKQQSIDRLMKEGIFFKNKELAPSLIIQRLAIISVETSKGYHDFLNVIDNNEWGYCFFHMLFPALLQGEGAVNSIVSQLARIRKATDHFDAVLIIRGGGGDVGLSSFDHYKLASAVAKFPVPVITGIGHATNFTVTEQVAYENKITPTEVAYFLIQKFHNYAVRIENAQKVICDRSRDIVAAEKSRIRENGNTLKTVSDSMLYNNTTSLVSYKHQLFNSTSSIIERNRSLLLNSMIKLSSSVSKMLMTSNFKVTTLEDKVALLHPENILKRGYSITTKSGKVIFDSDQLTIDDEIETIFKKGKIKSKVTKK